MAEPPPKRARTEESAPPPPALMALPTDAPTKLDDAQATRIKHFVSFATPALMLSLDRAQRRREWLQDSLKAKTTRRDELKAKGNDKSAAEATELADTLVEMKRWNEELRPLLQENQANTRMHHALSLLVGAFDAAPATPTVAAHPPTPAHPMAGLSVEQIEAIVERKFNALAAARAPPALPAPTVYSSAGLTPDDVKRLVEQETYKSLNGDAFALRLETALSTSHPFEKLKRDVGELESTKADKSRMSTLEETLETSIKRAVRNVTDDLERVETSSKRLGEDISGLRHRIEATDSMARETTTFARDKAKELGEAMSKVQKRVEKLNKASNQNSPMGGRAGSVMTPGMDDTLSQRVADLEHRFRHQQPSSPAGPPPPPFAAQRLDDIERRADEAVQLAQSASTARNEVVEHVERLLGKATTDFASRGDVRALAEQVEALTKTPAGMDETAVRAVVGQVIKPFETTVATHRSTLDAHSTALGAHEERIKQTATTAQLDSRDTALRAEDDRLKQAYTAMSTRLDALAKLASESANKAEVALKSQQNQAQAGPSNEALTAVTHAHNELAKRVTAAEAAIKQANIELAVVAEIKKRVDRLHGLWPATFKQADAIELRKATQRLADLTTRLTDMDARVVAVDQRCTKFVDRFKMIKPYIEQLGKLLNQPRTPAASTPAPAPAAAAAAAAPMQPVASGSGTPAPPIQRAPSNAGSQASGSRPPSVAPASAPGPPPAANGFTVAFPSQPAPQPAPGPPGP